MDIIESDNMPVELYYKFYTDPYSCVGEKSQEKNEKVFWREDKVCDFKQCDASSRFSDCIVRATNIMDDCINASLKYSLGYCLLLLVVC